MKALIIAEDGFEDSELLYPFYRLREAGFEVDVASSGSGNVSGKHGYSATVTKTYADCRVQEYSCLVLPGGKSPERARLVPAVLELTRAFVAADKPVAAICHGAQVLISAGVVKGRELTCYAGIRDDVKAAGGRYLDKPCVVDGNLVTSRVPDDLPRFMAALLQRLA